MGRLSHAGRAEGMDNKETDCVLRPLGSRCIGAGIAINKGKMATYLIISGG